MVQVKTTLIKFPTAKNMYLPSLAKQQQQRQQQRQQQNHQMRHSQETNIKLKMAKRSLVKHKEEAAARKRKG